MTRRSASTRPHLAIICILLDARQRAFYASNQTDVKDSECSHRMLNVVSKSNCLIFGSADTRPGLQERWRVKPRSHRVRRRVSKRVDVTTFGLLASNVCIFDAPPIRCFYALTLCALQIVFTITITIHPAVNHVSQLRHCHFDVISTGVVR